MGIMTKFSIFLFSLLAASLFAFLETAFTALRLFKLKELELSVAKYKSLFDSWEKNPQRILITILIANNFAHVLTSVMISEIMERYLGTWGLAVGVAIATVTILIIGEIIPKSFAKTHHERLFGSFLWMINLMYHTFYPFVTVLLKIADFFLLRVGSHHILEKSDTVVSEKEIEFLIDYSDQKGIMEAAKTEMLQNIFSLGQTTVREIMIPKNDMILLNASSSLQEAMDKFHQTRFSRLPIYQDDPDNIIGFIHQKNIFNLVFENKTIPLQELALPIMFIPETQRVNQLLNDFLKKRIHMAIVIDEYGIITGLITLEDILEEIVGEITDEHEVVNEQVIPIDQGGWLIEANISLEKLEDVLNVAMIAQNSITLAGFLMERFGYMPKKGDRLVYEGYCFQIQQATTRRILQVLVFEHKDDPDMDVEA